MGPLLSDEFWAYFASIQKDAFETFGQDTLTYYKKEYNMDYFGEDGTDDNTLFTQYDLPILINYNYYRVWGVNTNSQAGEVEGQSISVLINKDKLREVQPALMDDRNNFIFDSGKDYFIHRGTRYTSQGETFISQAASNPLLIMLILQVDKRFTHEDKGNQS
jgi:hypothetical protein